MTDTDAIRTATAQLRALVAQAQADRCPWDAPKRVYQQSMATIMDTRLGPLANVADQIDAALDVEPEPVPAPVPTPVTSPGSAGSYVGHDPAVDAYLGGEWGPHHGIALKAPAAGRVELYQFGTPLPAMYALAPARQAEYIRHHHELFDGWVCIASDHRRPGLAAGMQQMAVFVWWPDTPYVVQGVALQWIGGAHVDAASVRQGRVNAGDIMAQTSNSGINFERAGYPEARAAHWHAICGRTATLSPNGDISGYYAIAALGFPAPRHEGKPGPSDYEQRGADGNDLYCAGRLRSEFVAAGVPIPPPPPGQ